MAAVPKVLGRIAASATTATDVFGPGSPERTGATFCVHILNRNANAASVRLGLSSTSATFEATGYLLYNSSIPSGGWIQVTGLACDNDYLVYYSDVADTTCIAMGVDVP